MIRQLLVFGFVVLASVQVFATDCELITTAGSAQQTALKVTSADQLTTTMSATVGNVTASVQLSTIVGDNPSAPQIRHLQARILVDKAFAAQMISDSMKAGDNFILDAPGIRLFCQF